MSHRLFLKHLAAVKKQKIELDWQNRNLAEGIISGTNRAIARAIDSPTITRGLGGGNIAFGVPALASGAMAATRVGQDVLSRFGIGTTPYETGKEINLPYSNVSFNPEKWSDYFSTGQIPAGALLTLGGAKEALRGKPNLATEAGYRVLMPVIAGTEGIEALKAGQQAYSGWEQAARAYQQGKMETAKNAGLAAWNQTRNALESGSVSTAAGLSTVGLGGPMSHLTFGRSMGKGGTESLLKVLDKPASERTTADYLNIAGGVGGIAFDAQLKHQLAKELAQKAAAKGLAKKIPLVGFIPGLWFGAQRVGDAIASAVEGDIEGAGMDLGAAAAEVASGAAGSVPGIGTLGSVGADVGLGAYDYYKKQREQERKKQNLKENTNSSLLLEDTIRNILNKNNK